LRSAASRVGRRLLAGAVVLLAHAALPSAARAACTVSATGVNFGAYDVFAATPNDSTGTVTYRCASPDRGVSIALSPGGSGTSTNRQMGNGAGTDRLAYNLFFDATRSAIWGDGTGTTTYYIRNNPPNNRDVSVTIYGRIAPGQDVAVGSYTDTIIVTINF
jgi:spore coat protein U-like protein